MNCIGFLERYVSSPLSAQLININCSTHFTIPSQKKNSNKRFFMHFSYISDNTQKIDSLGLTTLQNGYNNKHWSLLDMRIQNSFTTKNQKI